MTRQMLALGAICAVLLTACPTPPPTPPPPPPPPPPAVPVTFQGSVNASPAAGGQPFVGAKVDLTIGTTTKSTTTDPQGKYSLKFDDVGKSTTFTLTATSPAANARSRTYQDIPLAAYASPYGSSGELNIFMGGSTVTLGGYPIRQGNLTGVITDGANPVVSTNPLTRRVSTPAGSFGPCIPNGVAPCLFDPPQTGEDGLVLFGGSGGRVVVTGTGGAFTIPVRSSNNLFAASGSLWAGNYDGTDTGNPKTANEYFWTKFAYLPNVNVFIGPDPATPPVVTQNAAFEAFDPTSNATRVTTLSMTHDLAAIGTPNILSQSIPGFQTGVTSSEVELGQYYSFTAPRNMRVYKIPVGVKDQQIVVNSDVFVCDKDCAASDSILIGKSSVHQYRDGTNLSSGLTASFLGIPSTQSPAPAATGVSLTPTLTWKAVTGGKVYNVTVVEDSSKKTVWDGITTATTIKVPVTLKANTKYVWQVTTDDQNDPTDYISSDPLAMEASRWINLSNSAKLRNLNLGSLNAARGELAMHYLATTGRIPTTISQDGSSQNLLTTGSREVESDTPVFTTGN